MQRRDTVWQRADTTKLFLESVRGAIPLAGEQIDVMLRVIRAAVPDGVGSFLDLGCGDGLLGQAVLGDYPQARGVFLDFSEPMLDAARARIGEGANHVFVAQDYGTPDWVGRVREYAPFDAVVSGFSIHHQPDERKRAVYAEIYDLLKPGGVFLNLEHVAPATAWVEDLFSEIMIESMAAAQPDKTRERVAEDFHNRPDREANILAPMEAQLEWLRAVGYAHVDCYLKIFELALFGGIRPKI